MWALHTPTFFAFIYGFIDLIYQLLEFLSIHRAAGGEDVKGNRTFPLFQRRLEIGICVHRKAVSAVEILFINTVSITASGCRTVPWTPA